MDMKRLTFLLLMAMLVSATAWAGVQLNLDSGNISGSTDLLDATETSIEGVADSETAVGEGGTTEETLSLTAVLSLSQDSVKTLEGVTLDASGSRHGDGEIILYEWDLNGDGVFDESSDESAITHSYSEDGVVSVQVRITDDLGKSGVSEVLLLTVANQQPLARFAVDTGDSAEGSLVQFVDSSYDNDGLIASWAWDFGDGFTSNEPSPSHIYNAGGSFSVTLLATDNDGSLSEPYVFEVEVLNTAPQAEFRLQQSTASVGSPLTFIDESFDSSNDGDIIHVAWDFGDGAYQAGGPSLNSEYSHTFAVAGTYVVTLYVIDDQGALGRAQTTIHVP